MSHRHYPKNGFTLIELLVVMGIIVILAGLSYPLITSMNQAGQINRTIAEVSGSLEVARQYAVAQNTYVWVAFAAPDPNSAYQFDMVTVASTDGTEVLMAGTGTPPGPSTWGGTTSTGSLILVAPIKSFPLTNLAKPGTVTPATPPSNQGSALASNATFSFTLPQGAATTFAQAVEFTPNGEARVASGTPVSLIEFDLQPYKGPGVINAKNGAVFQIDGLTGATHVYRQ